MKCWGWRQLQRLVPLSGLRAYPFQGFHDITEVECTGRLLDADSDLLTLVLFTQHDDRILASANLKSRECSTSSSFSSCLIELRDSHGTRLRSLVVDLPEGRARVVGCNATGLKSGGRLITRTRFKSVARISEYWASCFRQKVSLGFVNVARDYNGPFFFLAVRSVYIARW